MRKTAGAILLLCFLLGLLAGCGQGKEDIPAIADVFQEKPDTYSCSFDGVKHDFILYLPERSKGAPMVLLLPGYGNTAEAFRSETHFEKDALERGYAVAYVTGAPDPNIPTSALGWNSENNYPGNRDVEFLVAMAEYLQESYSLDSKRTYAVGFSNGAFMVHRLAMEAGDTFRACVSVAGLMQESVWNTRHENSETGFFQITGERDEVVPKNSDGSARYTKAPAIEDVVEYWADANGLKQLETETIGNSSVLMKYGENGKTQQVWHLIVAGGRHSWPSVRFNGIDTNNLILDFLDSQ